MVENKEYFKDADRFVLVPGTPARRRQAATPARLELNPDYIAPESALPQRVREPRDVYDASEDPESYPNCTRGAERMRDSWFSDRKAFGGRDEDARAGFLRMLADWKSAHTDLVANVSTTCSRRRASSTPRSGCRRTRSATPRSTPPGLAGTLHEELGAALPACCTDVAPLTQIPALMEVLDLARLDLATNADELRQLHRR